MGAISCFLGCRHRWLQRTTPKSSLRIGAFDVVEVIQTVLTSYDIARLGAGIKLTV
jgi:hypothetical protein